MYEDFFFITEENIDSFLKAPKKIRGEFTIIAELSSSNEKIYSDQEIINELKKLKPASAKGVYINNVALSSTMGPGIKINSGELV